MFSHLRLIGCLPSCFFMAEIWSLSHMRNKGADGYQHMTRYVQTGPIYEALVCITKVIGFPFSFSRELHFIPIRLVSIFS